ncbi:MAG TPA: hypothetical protein PLL78_14410 [Fimbriimonadaceae bacterium]|nr:hypothetical protein [Fimbriimonadaceae bacterium]HRJ97868.1 hypothetical protein [Fimbriimonadaceae bacterium]
MRLTFLALTAIGIIGCGSGPKAEPVTTVDALAPLVPKELALDPTPIPDSENGYLAMIEATDALQGSLSVEELQNFQKGSLPPATRKRAEALVEKNEKALALLEKAIALPTWRGPQGIGAASTFEELPKARTLLRLLLLRATLAQAKGDSAGAEKNLATAFRFSQRLLESKHCFITYLVGVAAQAQTTQAIRTAVWRPGMSARAVRSLAKALEGEAKDAFAGHVRGEFANYFLPELAKNIGPQSRTLEDIGGSTGLADDLREALKGHPQPFDRETTLREGAKLYLELIANLDRPRADRVNVVTMAGNQAAVWGEIVTSNAERIPSASMAALKARLAKEKNPYGRLMLYIGLPATVGDDDSRKANLDLTRIVVANRLYALGHGGRTAPKLADLGLNLTDPCSGKPYGYDARREIAWSVARNGKDDGGKSPVGRLRQNDPDWVVSLIGK